MVFTKLRKPYIIKVTILLNIFNIKVVKKMTTLSPQKVTVSVVSKDMPLERCPIGTQLLIRKEEKNQVDPKALAVSVRHKKTGKWTFIGYVATNPDFLPDDGINNRELFDLLGEKRKLIFGTVVDKKQVVFPYDVRWALMTEVEL